MRDAGQRLREGGAGGRAGPYPRRGRPALPALRPRGGVLAILILLAIVKAGLRLADRAPEVVGDQGEKAQRLPSLIWMNRPSAPILRSRSFPSISRARWARGGGRGAARPSISATASTRS